MVNKKNLLVGLFVILLVNSIFLGYLILRDPKPVRGDFNMPQFTELTDEQKIEITSFFQSTTDTSEIEDYCNENRSYCMYYCRDINSNHAYCEELRQNRPSGGRQFPQ